jgi:hypothetical protein
MRDAAAALGWPPRHCPWVQACETYGISLAVEAPIA